MVVLFHVDLTTIATETAPIFPLVPVIDSYNVQRIIRLVWLISLVFRAGRKTNRYGMQAVVSLSCRMDALFSSSMSTSYKQSPHVLTEIHVPGAKKELPSKMEWFSFPSRLTLCVVMARWSASAAEVQTLLSRQRTPGTDCWLRVSRAISMAYSRLDQLFSLLHAL